MRSSLLSQIESYCTSCASTDADYLAMNHDQVVARIGDHLLSELDRAIPVFGVPSPATAVCLSPWPMPEQGTWHPTPKSLRLESNLPLPVSNDADGACKDQDEAFLLIRNTIDTAWFMLIVREPCLKPGPHVPLKGAWSTVIARRCDGLIQGSAHGKFHGIATGLVTAANALHFMDTVPQRIALPHSSEDRIRATTDFREVTLPNERRPTILTQLQSAILKTLWQSRGQPIRGEALMAICGSELLKPVDAFKKIRHPAANRIYKALVQSNRTGYWIKSNLQIRFL